MRGTLAVRDRAPMVEGIIPAYAGNTWLWRGRALTDRDHPRVCGEHSHSTQNAAMGTGSSPRMRGTQHARFDVSCRHGIIPAYAGNTGLIRGPRHHRRDHPRVCGEHAVPVTCNDPSLGSSPRMRGTRALQTRRMGAVGIIPAYAGNTGGSPTARSPRRDHPRVCGEHFRPLADMSIIAGSSPRMRGTPRSSPTAMAKDGIIPAYAGNTRPTRG